MVSHSVGEWIGSVDALKAHLTDDAWCLDPAYQSLSKEDVFKAWETLDPKKALITSEFSRILVTQDDLKIRLKLHQDTITRFDLAWAPLSTYRQAVIYGYDGSRYYGSQIQPNQPTVQGALEGMLNHLFQKEMTVYPASRTDAGVHALNAVAHFDAPFYMAPDKLCRLLKKMAPSDILIHDVIDVSLFFHARYDVVSKTYLYRFTTQKDVGSMHKKSHLEIEDVDAFMMRLKLFEGTHDFKAFAKSKGQPTDTVRNVQSITWVQDAPHAWTIEITGDGFLRHMIRMMVGAAMTLTPKAIQESLESPSAKAKKTLAPPEGLYLKTLVY